jgi:signal peptidase I
MVPTLNIGDIVFAKSINASEIVTSTENGDIVVIKGPQYYFEQGYPQQFLDLANNTPIIHRVVEKSFNPSDGLWYFVTKGDANLEVDGAYTLINYTSDGSYFTVGYNASNAIKIPQTQIIGKVYFSIPGVGYFQMYSTAILCFLGTLFVIVLIMDRLKIQISIKFSRMGRSGELQSSGYSGNE